MYSFSDYVPMYYQHLVESFCDGLSFLVIRYTFPLIGRSLSLCLSELLVRESNLIVNYISLLP